MNKAIDQRLPLLNQAVNRPLLSGILRGIERETLRSDPKGQLALTAHPEPLGSALTHPLITTDFSESLLEFITPPSHDLSGLTEQLWDIHRFTYEHLGSEVLWPTSMPCAVGMDSDIPIAQYGSSNRAQMKTAYRVGLGHRYGRTMQTVAGVHYNFSLPRSLWALLHQEEGSAEELSDFIDRRYLDLIRNFRRNYWLLIYLFGASPAVCSSFVQGRNHQLQTFEQDDQTLYLPHATALRMSNLGYQSSAQESLFVCYNSLTSYVETLTEAIRTPYDAYEKIGLQNDQGDMLQLNTSLLQIENEFYSPIRPKRVAHAGETALTALCRRGIEYIEVRCLDINPFDPLGISESQISFLDTFLLHCLLSDSPYCDAEEFSTISENQKRVVNEGRKPGLRLLFNTDEGKQERSLTESAQQLLSEMAGIADLLDNTHDNQTDHPRSYASALRQQQQNVQTPDNTPSAQMLAAMRAENLGHAYWALMQGQIHRDTLMKSALPQPKQRRLVDMAEESLRLRDEEEAQKQAPFEAYIKQYYGQYTDCNKS